MIIEWTNNVILQSLNFAKAQVLYTGLLLIVLLPAVLFFKKRYPLLVMGLCWLVIARAVLPADLGSPVSVRALWDALFTHANVNVVQDTVRATTSEVDAYERFMGPVSNEPSWLEFILFYTWFFISGFFLLKFYLQRIALRKVLRLAKPVRNFELVRACVVWRARLNVKREIRLVCSAHCPFIYTMGSLRPTICIPQYMLGESNTRHLEIAIAHEVAHIKRFDDGLLVLQSVIQRLFFFNPALWVCGQFIYKSRELCCDQEVLSKQIFQAHEYCDSLINLVSSHPRHGVTPAFGSKQKLVLVERFSFINGVNSMKKLNKRKTLMAVSLMGAFVLPMAPFSGLSALEKNGETSYVTPVKLGWLSSEYGNRVMPVGVDKGKQKFHRGIDIAGEKGTPVYAVSSGKVLKVVNDYENSEHPEFGNYVVIEHSDGRQSHYMHLQSVDVSEGQAVVGDSLIATMGNTGQASGPHLHLEIYQDGEHVNPAALINLENLAKK